MWQFFDAIKEAADANRYEGGSDKGVHSIYESKMLDRHADKIVPAIDDAIKNPADHNLPEVKRLGRHDAVGQAKFVESLLGVAA